MNVSADAELTAEVFALRPLPKFTSQGDLLRYVERTRRQLERFDRLPKGDGNSMDPEGSARIRALCDELEADILAGLPA